MFTEVKKEFTRVTGKAAINKVDSLRGEVSQMSLDAFSWVKVKEEVNEKMPLFYNLLMASMPSTKKLAGQFLKGRRNEKRLEYIWL